MVAISCKDSLPILHLLMPALRDFKLSYLFEQASAHIQATVMHASTFWK